MGSSYDCHSTFSTNHTFVAFLAEVSDIHVCTWIAIVTLEGAIPPLLNIIGLEDQHTTAVVNIQFVILQIVGSVCLENIVGFTSVS